MTRTAALHVATLPPATSRGLEPGERHNRTGRQPGTPQRSAAHETCRLTVRVAAALLAVIAVTGTVIRLVAAAPIRRWLDYAFTGVPARPGEAAVIFAHNGRALCGVSGLLLIAQVALREPAGPGSVQRALRCAGESLLAGLIAANVLVVGASLGAYGPRMARAMLPHGLLELAAFALALALYLQGRRRALPVRYLVTTGAMSVLLLAAAAALETFVTV